MDMIYKPEDLNGEYYKLVKKLNDAELEHQIGRLLYFKKIIGKICNKNIRGDIIEFGSWKGFSLLWIVYLFERSGIFDKKIIGIDCFDGLPYSEGPFIRGGFKNTSLKECRNNIYRSRDLYDVSKKNIYVEKFLFSETTKIINHLKFLKINKVCFVHIDSDLSKSFLQAMKVLLQGNIMADHCFILVDDYGNNKKLSRVVDKEMQKLGNKWRVTLNSQTFLSRNYELIKK
jgi:hypothetical protein